MRSSREWVWIGKRKLQVLSLGQDQTAITKNTSEMAKAYTQASLTNLFAQHYLIRQQYELNNIELPQSEQWVCILKWQVREKAWEQQREAFKRQTKTNRGKRKHSLDNRWWWKRERKQYRWRKISLKIPRWKRKLTLGGLQKSLRFKGLIFILTHPTCFCFFSF